jgi:hypothetical protein
MSLFRITLCRRNTVRLQLTLLRRPAAFGGDREFVAESTESFPKWNGERQARNYCH